MSHLFQRNSPIVCPGANLNVPVPIVIVPFEFTVPIDFPLTRIDHTFHSPGRVTTEVASPGLVVIVGTSGLAKYHPAKL